MSGAKRKDDPGAWSKGPPLDDATFRILRRRIVEASGIFIAPDENARFILEKRLAPRLRVRGVTSFPDYADAMDESELESMLDAVAVHETYFFREKRQLSAFAGHVLPELAGARPHPIRIWSAGCSTGEEAYTIAMLLAEAGLLDWRFAAVYASDLSRRVVEAAVRGVYTESSFRTTDELFRQRYFERLGGASWRVSPELQHGVQFEQLNLVKLNDVNLSGGLAAWPPGGGGFDVIFCRNVLMYFDDAAARRAIESFYSLLNEGGFLLLGHAESLLPAGSNFESVQYGRELLHRK
jgi:chemotaxis protein methyltransferase CheR